LRIPCVDSSGEGFHISPDGQKVAFGWNKTGQWHVYLIGVRGGEPTQLTAGTESCISPRFSPDGRKLAYLQDYRGDEKFDIFILDLDSGRAENITPNTDEAILPSIRWSPDGRRIAFASNRGGKYSVYTMPSSGGDASQLYQHEYADSDPRWSPDGKLVMFASMTRGQDQGVFIVPANGGDVVQVGDANGPLDASMPGWSPDSRRIAFASTAHGMCDIGIYDLVEQQVQWLTDSSYECYSPVWCPDGSMIAYKENRDGNVVIVLQRLDGTKRVFQLEQGIHDQQAFTPDSKHLVHTFSSSRRPTDVWILDIREEKSRQLTNSLPSSIDLRLLAIPTVARYPSVGGRTIPALLYKPLDWTEGTKAPAVVFIHGGPAAQHDYDWYPTVQDFVARGFVVLSPNYRGSTGYGKEFRDANRFVMGRDDLADIVAAASFLKHELHVDPERIAVTGISYGGYLTMCALTKHPELWAVGSALFPFVNWFTEYENEREDLQYWDGENMGDPSQDPERFREASPIFFMESVQAAVQLVAGAQDPRCPMSESVQARDVLLKLGKTVEFVVYEDEGHGFRKTENWIEAMKKRAAFLERHLLGA